MPVKTVTLQVSALTDEANRRIAATGAYFQKLKDQNPAELTVKLNRLQAIAESKILAKEMATTVNDTIKLNLDGGGIGGLIGRLFRGGEGAGKGLPGPLGGIPGIGPIPPIGQLPPAAAIGGLAAALASLPFLAQAAAGAITLGLGGALAGLGIYGAVASASVGKVTVTALQLAAAQKAVAAAQDKLSAAQASGKDNTGQLDRAYAGLASAQDHLGKVQAAWASQQLPAAAAAMHKAFGTLSSDAQDSLRKIGASFVPVLTAIAKTADVVLKDLTPAFAAAVKVISGPFQLVADTLLKSFASPQAVTAIKTLGTAFAGLLKAFAPSIPGIVTSIADGFTNLFRAVARNPKAFADMATGLFHLVGILLDVLAWLTNVADYVEHHWKPIMLGVAGPILDHWHGLADFFTKTLPGAFKGIVTTALQSALGIANAFGQLPGPLGYPFRKARDAIAATLAGITGDAQRQVANTKTAFELLNGLTANLYVYTNFVNIGTPPGGIFPTPSGLPPGVRPIGTQPGTGPQPGRHAAGTLSAAPGWAWVGEQGAGLVRFGGGETVLPASVSRGYASGTGRSAQIDELIGAVQENTDVLSSAIATLANVSARAPAVMGAAAAGGARSAVYSSLYP